MRRLLLLFLCLTFYRAEASDSLRFFGLKDLYGLVLENHPVVKQAGLLNDVGRMEVRAARGLFDPQLRSAYEEKRYGGNDYWKIWQSSLRVPVWSGIDLRADFSQATGDDLDPMLQTPGQGLGSLGLQLPLGQGLLIDARRSALLQAKLMQDLLEAERFSIVNKLLMQVNKDYWDWAYGYQRVKLNEEGVRLAELRYEAIRYKVLLGELPSLDSIEALLEVQNRQNLLMLARIDYTNSSFQLSNHLWTDDGLPAELPPSVVPFVSDSISYSGDVRPLVQWLDSANVRHPELLKAEAKIGQLEVEKRWAAERLRPRIQLDYNLYSYEGSGFSEAGLFTPYWSDNMKVGLSFSTSLFMREERGKYGLAKLKVQQARYDQQRLRRDIYNQVRAAYAESELLAEQLDIQTGQVRSAERLLEGEQARFNEGESSLFLLNNRENVLINGRIRQAECRSKLEKARATVRWAAGSLLSP